MNVFLIAMVLLLTVLAILPPSDPDLPYPVLAICNTAFIFAACYAAFLLGGRV